MSLVRCYAVAPLALRNYVGGGGNRHRLRALAADRYVVSRPRLGMLGKLGPLSSRPLPPEPDAQRPTRADIETLLAGLPVRPARLRQAWQILGVWMAADARATLTLDLTWEDLLDLDAAATRAGVPARLGLATMFTRDSPIPVAPLPTMRIGYRRAAQLRGMVDAFAALPAAETEHTVLGEFQQWLLALVDDPLDRRKSHVGDVDLLLIYTADEAAAPTQP